MRVRLLLCTTLLAILVNDAYTEPVGSCPKENEQYVTFLTDSDDCSIFYQCNWGVPYKYDCPGSLYFNPALNVCDYPEQTECGVAGGDNTDTTEAEVSTEVVDVTEETVADVSESLEDVTESLTECPAENGDYAVHLPHESDCTLFYTCNWGVPILQECPAGLHFNPSLEVCDWPADAGCGSGGDDNEDVDEGSGEDEDIDEGSGEDEDIDEGSGEGEDVDEGSGEDEDEDIVVAECPAENGEFAVHLPHESDCGLFYTCNWGVPILQECPAGLHFNPTLEVCDWPVDAGCGSGGDDNEDVDEGSGKDEDIDEGSGEYEDIDEGSGEGEDVDEGSGEDEDIVVAECPAENGEFAVHLPHESDCGLFYTCNWGVPILQECPAGLHFNPSLEVCDWPADAGCGSGGADNEDVDESSGDDEDIDEGSGEDEDIDEGSGEGEDVDEGSGEDDSSEAKQCPVDNSGFAVHLPHESDCTLFYVCDWGVPILRKCPANLHFNPSLEVCDWPESAGCQSGTEDSDKDEQEVENNDEEESGDDGAEEFQLNNEYVADHESNEDSEESDDNNNNVVGECPAENGEYIVLLPHESDCNLFYECDWGTPILKECPDNLHFNPILNVCDYPEDAGCAIESSGEGESGDGESADFNEEYGYNVASENDDDSDDHTSGFCDAVSCLTYNEEFVPSTSDCTRFCRCSYGAVYEFVCPAGLYFNPILNVCDYPEESGCVEHN